MEAGLLIFAVVMACAAAAMVVYCLVAEMSEAWNIRQLGWLQGHRTDHLAHHHR